MAEPTPTPQRHHLAPCLEDVTIDAVPDFAAILGLSRTAAHRAVRKLEDAGQLSVIRTGKKTRIASADVLRLLGLDRATAAEIAYGTTPATGAPADEVRGTERPATAENTGTMDSAL